jgi:hypothetical protein
MKLDNFTNKSKGFQESIRVDARKVLKDEHDEKHKDMLAEKLRILRILDNSSELKEFCYKVVNG